MKSQVTGALTHMSATVWRVATALVAAAVLVGCGGGGQVPFTGVTMRPLSPEFTSRKAVNYMPFRTAIDVNDRENEVITEAMVKQDLDLLLQAGFGLIRQFDCSDKVAKLTLQVIRTYNLNIKVQVGAYMQSGDDAANQAEISRCIALANQFSDSVLAVSVGNENMVSWSLNRIEPTVMAGYISQVRRAINQPVTTDDNYAFWATAPNSITDVVDYVSLHTYTILDTVFDPNLWDWKQQAVPEAERATAMMDASIVEARRQYNLARSALDSKGLTRLPITIGETGWNAVDLGRLRFRAHPVNQKMYYDRLQVWATEGRTGAGPKAIFYFEAFDEPWKQGDDKWGLFNVERQARFVIQALNPPSSTWVYEPGTYTAEDAVFFKVTEPGPPVTASPYKVYAEAGVPAATVSASCNLDPAVWRIDAFDGSTAVWSEINSTFAPGDAANSCEIMPRPRDYGWGVLYQFVAGAPAGGTVNLSEFAATGKLNFGIKTTYPGKIEIGLSTDSGELGGQEVFLPIGNGDFGYCNTGEWCQVSIPLSVFKAANPNLDFSRVVLQFVISDVYSRTGKPANSNIRTPIVFDAVTWSK